MLAAIPYALVRPVIDPIVARVQARRFYRQAWQRGLDVKLGLAVWNPWDGRRLQIRTRDALCGLGTGIAFLFDYSGAVFIALLVLTGAVLYGIWSPRFRRER
jgi:hypothetical protein